MKNKLELIDNKIYLIRGQRVLLDFDLAELYGSETKRLKEAVKRNLKRFPTDFMFELTKEEFESLRSQIASSNKRGGTRYMPYAFTEQGVAMLSTVLNSETAIEINISIMRAFVKVRQLMQYTASPVSELSEIKKQIQELKEDMESLNKDHEVYENQFDELFSVFGELSLKLRISQERAERKPIEGFRKKDIK
jgi:phage regulator Rha-like protein